MEGNAGRGIGNFSSRARARKSAKVKNATREEKRFSRGSREKNVNGTLPVYRRSIIVASMKDTTVLRRLYYASGASFNAPLTTFFQPLAVSAAERGREKPIFPGETDAGRLRNLEKDEKFVETNA